MNKATLVLLPLLIIFSCSKEDKFDYPVVFIGDVINLTDTSATYAANITNLGNHKIIESGFVWGVHSLDNNGIKIKNEVTKEGEYELRTNYKLLPGKTYYVRAYVQTESEVTYSKEISFSSYGQINKGKWSPLVTRDFEGGSVLVLASFTFQDTTFFTLENGTMYYYSHIDNRHGFLLSNPLLANVRLSVVYNDFAYLFINNTFYRFDIQSKTLTKLDSPEKVPKNAYVTGFIINDNIYLGNLNTSNDFWKFNITQESWEQLNSFPGRYLYERSAFTLNNTGYIASSYLEFSYQINDLWQYIPDNDQWIRKHDLNLGYTNGMTSTSIADFGYSYVDPKGFFEYNPLFDIWEKKASIISEEPMPLKHLFTAYNKLFAVSFGNRNTSASICQLWVYEK
jgi:hypothetical protein